MNKRAVAIIATMALFTAFMTFTAVWDVYVGWTAERRVEILYQRQCLGSSTYFANESRCEKLEELRSGFYKGRVSERRADWEKKVDPVLQYAPQLMQQR
ncbi:MAG: hypothetical protein HYY60_02345 [Parcubacteria group bacterium]|nr:hypothetical protein [Parcubacteria group bacterium]